MVNKKAHKKSETQEEEKEQRVCKKVLAPITCVQQYDASGNNKAPIAAFEIEG